MVACVVLGLLTGQSTALFKGCYLVCFAGCIHEPPKNPLTCVVKCAKECFGLHSSLGIQTDPKHFCKLGCAASLCANIITAENPGQSQATFQECYAGCMLVCFIKQHKIGCFAKCLKSCFVIPTDIQAKPEHYCKLGCATSLCSNISTKDNIST
ncbi:hypothetical protein PRUPE_3G072600 [Prunus persica]|uniref:Thionin-like protein 2 n=1 Tax=Prunus persica TaxID=3760 RepID=A0A251PWR6_PRUPE|nr:hypothetical protein PRUPE_3G072600 [Prunus persica]